MKNFLHISAASSYHDLILCNQANKQMDKHRDKETLGETNKNLEGKKFLSTSIKSPIKKSFKYNNNVV